MTIKRKIGVAAALLLIAVVVVLLLVGGNDEPEIAAKFLWYDKQTAVIEISNRDRAAVGYSIGAVHPPPPPYWPPDGDSGILTAYEKHQARVPMAIGTSNIVIAYVRKRDGFLRLDRILERFGIGVTVASYQLHLTIPPPPPPKTPLP